MLILSRALVAIVKDVYGFEFGSSRGSQDKTDQLTALMGGGTGLGLPPLPPGAKVVEGTPWVKAP